MHLSDLQSTPRNHLRRAGALLWAVAMALIALGAFQTAARSAQDTEADAILLHLQVGTFDPVSGVPDRLSPVPTGAPSPGAPAAGTSPSYVIVQFTGPPEPGWLRNITATGSAILDYLPTYAFLVRAPAGASRQLARLTHVRWTGPWRPEYRVAPELWALSGTLTTTVQFFPGDDAQSEAQALAAAPDIRLLARSAADGRTILRLRFDRSRLPEVAALTHVRWIEPYVAPRIRNDIATQITGVITAWQSPTLTGTGQTIAIADTGLDLGGDSPPADFGRRTVIGQCIGRPQPCRWDDPDGHGTHVAGTAAGDGARSAGALRGVAPGADLIIQSVYSPTQPGGLYLPPDLGKLLGMAYTAGARIHNNSWGSPGNRYDTWAETLDRFVWEHPDLLVVAAAGNDGSDYGGDGVIDPGSLQTPATAKNSLAVGATESVRPAAAYTGTYGASPDGSAYPANPVRDDGIADDPRGLAAFSSRGPAADGRTGVDLVAPGTNILSARSHHPEAAYAFVHDADYAYASGTSQAAPLVSGAAALVRQWYGEHHGVTGSAALLRATLVHGATDLTPGQYGPAISGTVIVSDPVGAGGIWTSTTWVLTHTAGAHSGDLAWLAPGGLGIKRLDAVVDLADTVTPVLHLWHRTRLRGTEARIFACGTRQTSFTYRNGGATGWAYLGIDLTPCAGNGTALIRFEAQCLVSESYCASDLWAIDDLTITEGGRASEIGPAPDPGQGWGRLDVAAGLGLGTGDRRFYTDTVTGLAVNEAYTYVVDVAGPAVPFKATLAWTDYPATPAAAVALVNDLDLSVITFDGQQLHSNGLATTDRRNTIEQITIHAPTTGTYTVSVRAHNVPFGPQPFALVVSADIRVPPPPLYMPLVLRTGPRPPNTIFLPLLARQATGGTAMTVGRAPRPITAR